MVVLPFGLPGAVLGVASPVVTGFPILGLYVFCTFLGVMDKSDSPELLPVGLMKTFSDTAVICCDCGWLGGERSKGWVVGRRVA